MENNWSPVSFSDAVNLNPTVKLTKGEEYPFVDMKSVDPAWREVTFSELRAFKSGGAKFIPKDTLMARITPCLENGKIARYLPAGKKGEAFGSTEFIVIRGKDGVTDNDFAYYLTMWPEFRDFAISQMTGSSGRQRVPVDSLAGFNFNLPPLTEQKAIAHILGSLDDKIELNRRMNETLEAMAQALFKSWFIDFDPVLDNAIIAGNSIPDELEERAEIRRAILGQNQPSPPAPLPEVEGSSKLNYRGGFDFSGLLDTARELRQKQTAAEEIMWVMLRNRNFMGLKFRRQHQFGEYIADFYCHEAKLVVELDGKIHEQKIAKDQKRDAYMQSIGLTVLRFTNEDFLSNPESVLSKIADALSDDKSSSPTDDGNSVRDGKSSSPTGRGGGEGFSDEIRKLFPSEFERTQEMGWIPKGWKVSTVGEEVEIVGGGTPSTKDESYWTLGMHAFCAPKDMSTLPTKVLLNTERLLTDKGVAKVSSGQLPSGTVLMSSRAPIGYLAIADVPVTVNQGIIAMLKQERFSELFLLCWASCNMDKIMAKANGSTFLEISKKNFRPIPFLLPEDDIRTAFNSQTDAITKRLISCTRNMKELSAIRDTLLPQLLSGELRIEDAEKMVGEMRNDEHLF